MKSDRWPGFKVSLRVDGKDLQEYVNPEGSEDHTVEERYVEAIANAKFKIHVRANQRSPFIDHEIEMKTFLDGATAACSSRILRPKDLLRGYDLEGAQAYVKKLWCSQNFMFADLQTTDEVPKTDLKKKLDGLGSVTVHFTCCVTTKSFERFIGGQDHNAADVTISAIPEKALKGRAISKCIALGEAKPTSDAVVHADYPWGRRPFAKFTFKYRSHNDLQIEGIIPRSPTPVPLEERDADTLTVEEARELVRRHRQREDNNANVKREKRQRSVTIVKDEGEEDAEGEVTLTEERSSKRSKTHRDSGVEIIDLSCD